MYRGTLYVVTLKWITLNWPLSGHSAFRCMQYIFHHTGAMYEISHLVSVYMEYYLFVLGKIRPEDECVLGYYTV